MREPSRSEAVELLRRLCEAFGPSGFEDEVREVLARELEGVADEVYVDRLGNLYAVRRGSGEYKVVVTAHMDEIGFVVKHVDDRGFVWLAPVGGWSERVLPAQRVRIRSTKGGYVIGVIGHTPPHIMKPEEAKQVIPIDKLFVDIGASSRSEAEEMGVTKGCPVTLHQRFEELGRGRVTCKALDDRSGLVAALMAFKLAEPEVTVYFVATSREEVGLKGARVAAYRVDPDAVIALDVGLALDVPGVEESKRILEMGKGPGITIVDGRSGSGTISDPRLVELLRRVAEEHSIPYQVEVSTGGTTDATAMQIARGGVPVVTVSIPARYIHGPSEVIDVGDLLNTVKLVGYALEAMTPRWIEENLPRTRVLYRRG